MKQEEQTRGKSRLRRGDVVMVIAGGNKKSRPIKGKVGKILRFVGRGRQRVVVEGLNMITRHHRARGPQKPAARIQKEAPLHISRVMYYVEKLKRPVRLMRGVLADGTLVRGYRDRESGKFVQIAD